MVSNIKTVLVGYDYKENYFCELLSKLNAKREMFI